MANRLTDTEKWNDPWFCGLTPSYKLFWTYLCDNCNHAGIWKVNWPLVKFHCLEEKFDHKVFQDRIRVLSPEKWFIEKSVLFQQKITKLDELNPINPCHKSIIKLLQSENIINPLPSPSIAPSKGLARGQGKGKGKGKGKEGGVGETIKPFQHPPPKEFLELKKKIGNSLIYKTVKNNRRT